MALGTVSNLGSMFRFSLIIVCLAWGCSSDPAAERTQESSGGVVLSDVSVPVTLAPKPQEVLATIDLAQLKRDGALRGLPLKEARPSSDPFYKTVGLVLRGYDLASILGLNPRFAQVDKAKHSLRFVCVDGYRTTFSFSSITGATGILGIGVVTEAGLGWPLTPRGKTQEHAGPFYLVWDQQKYDKHRPWPYQLTRIELVSNAATAKGIAPPVEAGVDHGYALFKTHCLACHSVNLKGGKMGPELNVPQNILGYRDRSQLLKFVKSPQSFRAGSTMPPMALGDAALGAILDYLAVMAKHPVCTTSEACAVHAANRP